jgi:hypothetical protein
MRSDDSGRMSTAMAKKCCHAKPRCRNCPKRRKKAVAAPAEQGVAFYCPATIAISGQRGCTAKLPAGLAGAPAARRMAPAKAIIAPLSVQNSSSG